MRWNIDSRGCSNWNHLHIWYEERNQEFSKAVALLHMGVSRLKFYDLVWERYKNSAGTQAHATHLLCNAMAVYASKFRSLFFLHFRYSCNNWGLLSFILLFLTAFSSMVLLAKSCMVLLFHFLLLLTFLYLSAKLTMLNNFPDIIVAHRILPLQVVQCCIQ